MQFAPPRRGDCRHGHDGGPPERLRARRGNPSDGAAHREGQRIQDSRRRRSRRRRATSRCRVHRRLGLDGPGKRERATREGVPAVPGQFEAPRPREEGRGRDALPPGASRSRNHGRGDGRPAVHRLRSSREPTARAEGDPFAAPRWRLKRSRQPVYSPRPLRAKMRGLRGRLRILAGIVVLAATAVAILNPPAAINAIQLPLFALFSTTRMVLAYLLSLVFAITYGATAATNKKAAVIMLPVLDVLQSVPILGFFPAALVFFVATFQGSPVGIELAVVFLIFTSMAWNMAFGVYEALTTIPVDLEAAAASFGLRGMLRFRHLALPAAIPKLVYHSILSWSNGWFFLVASETFTAFGGTYTRPGLGSFIANAGLVGDSAGIAIGIGVLAAVVVALDTFLWRPLGVWSERFRMETTGHEVPRVPSPYERLRWPTPSPSHGRFRSPPGSDAARADPATLRPCSRLPQACPRRPSYRSSSDSQSS